MFTSTLFVYMKLTFICVWNIILHVNLHVYTQNIICGHTSTYLLPHMSHKYTESTAIDQHRPQVIKYTCHHFHSQGWASRCPIFMCICVSVLYGFMGFSSLASILCMQYMYTALEGDVCT